MTVAVDIITTEQYTLVITIDELLIPSNHFSCRCLTEVLAVNFRLVAVGVNVLGGLLSNLDGVTKSLLQLDSLGVVAGGVDGEALNLDGGLGLGGCSGTGDGDGGDFSVLDDRRSSGDGSESCAEKEMGTHDGPKIGRGER